jgi:hypothetical protein
MYSGYINVTTAPDYLFYWFFESQDKNPDAPVAEPIELIDPAQ